MKRCLIFLQELPGLHAPIKLPVKLCWLIIISSPVSSIAWCIMLIWPGHLWAAASNVLYDYNKFRLADSTPSKRTTTLLLTPQDSYANAVNSREILFYRGTDKDAGIGGSLSYPSAELIALYDQATDLRFNLFYLNSAGYKTPLGGGYDDGVRISNYRF